MVEIRRIRKSDLPELAKQFCSIWKEHKEKQVLKVWRRDLAKGVRGANLIALEGGKKVGVVMTEKLRIEISGAARITELFVEKGHRGKGIGSRLMKESLNAMKNAGMRNVSIMVSRKNKTALALYRAAGFKDFRLLMLKKFTH